MAQIGKNKETSKKPLPTFTGSYKKGEHQEMDQKKILVSYIRELLPNYPKIASKKLTDLDQVLNPLEHGCVGWKLLKRWPRGAIIISVLFYWNNSIVILGILPL